MKSLKTFIEAHNRLVEVVEKQQAKTDELEQRVKELEDKKNEP